MSTPVNRVVVAVVAAAIQRGCISLEKLQAMRGDGNFSDRDWNQFIELAGLEGKLEKAKGTTPGPEPETDPPADGEPQPPPLNDYTAETFGVFMDSDRIRYLSEVIFTKLFHEGRLTGKGPMLESTKGLIEAAIRSLVTEQE